MHVENQSNEFGLQIFRHVIPQVPLPTEKSLTFPIYLCLLVSNGDTSELFDSCQFVRLKTFQ